MTKETDLEIFVDRLFANQRNTKQARELKQEVLGNLEARVSDYMENGMDYQSAVSRAIETIENIEEFIDDHHEVYIYPFRHDLLQSALIYALLAWIISMPARFFLNGSLINTLLLCLVVILAVIYFGTSRNTERYKKRKATVNANLLSTWNRLSWLLWGVFIAVITAYTFVMHFGSDVWFGRALSIDGPYAFYVLFLQLALPFTSIIIPLVLRRAGKLTLKHEVSEE
ncbi:hypothetical protein JCM10914A_07210 [Paenibacillus sp. JCM 10914]|uniref:permease prefix domain 1-containing protein n=1 Tax=Paenibacillus sp. JCM 10914 TaxID=1236974 RepID=UPI0003CC8E6D|nr:permease prefix domain 1-containing protein [Paenibacillus sp. JCM 10914]GAE05774.1 hypothetical protein JCM10914_1896 [Paenibacillus sp. JCM 10914]